MAAEEPKVFDNEYFKIHKWLLITTGLWPYASFTSKTVKRFLIGSLLACFIIPNINGARIWCRKDFVICGENIASAIFTLVVILKYLTIIIFEQKLQCMYSLFDNNWFLINKSDEKKILQKFAWKGFFTVRLYIAYSSLTAFAFSQSCIINTVLDLIYPLNESRIKLLPVRGEYFFDSQEHHFKIYLGYCVLSIVYCIIFVTIDALYIVAVHQALATFNLVKHRITQASNYYSQDKDLGYKTIISAICMHKVALQFIDVIDSVFGLSLICLVSVSGAFISLVALVLLESLDHPFELAKYTMLEIGAFISLFIVSWPGQMVMDHGNELDIHIFNCEWIKMDKKGMRLIRIMLMQSSKGSQLTAYGLYILNYENYANIIKTALSCITIVLSLKE